MIPKTRKDSFEVLGLPESASTKEIKQAYYKLMQEWHPDKKSGESQEEKNKATEKSKEIIVAYKILTGEIAEEFISQQPNDDWVNDDWVNDYYTTLFYKTKYGSHLNKEELNLFHALDEKDLAQTKILLEKVRNINLQTRPCDMGESRDSILHYIVKNSCNDPKSGWVEFLEEVLLRYGANTACDSSIVLYLHIINVNIISRWEGTPLYVACELSSLDVIELLLKHGADPNVGHEPCTPFDYAVEKGKNDIVKLFVKHRCKIGTLNILQELNIIKSGEGMVEMLLPCLPDDKKKSMLFSIAVSGNMDTDYHLKIATLLLDAGASPFGLHSTKNYRLAELFAEYRAKFLLAQVGYTENQINDTLQGENAQLSTIGNAEHDSLQEQSLGISLDEVNNNLHSVKQNAQLSTIGDTEHDSLQKQSSGVSLRRWTIIGPALLFGAIGAALASMGIIPEIAAIGVIATAVLSGIVGAIVGGVAGYLVDVAINQCCDNTVNQGIRSAE